MNPALAARLALAGLLLAGSPEAVAASWTHFASCGDPGQERLYSYNAASARRSHGGTSALIRADYSRVPGSGPKHARLLWTINCDDRTFVEKFRVEMAATGRVLARYKETGPMVINPGSVAEKLFDSICR